MESASAITPRPYKFHLKGISEYIYFKSSSESTVQTIKLVWSSLFKREIQTENNKPKNQSADHNN